MPKPRKSKKDSPLDAPLAPPYPEGFAVYDDGKPVDLDDLTKERWASDLDCLESFALMEDGSLILCDDEGKYALCPERRFEVRAGV